MEATVTPHRPSCTCPPTLLPPLLKASLLPSTSSPVFSPFLQTPINPGCHFPGPVSGMSCALLSWQVSFPSPTLPHTLQSPSQHSFSPSAFAPCPLCSLSPPCQAASPGWACLQLDLMILIISSNLNDPVVHKNVICNPVCNQAIFHYSIISAVFSAMGWDMHILMQSEFRHQKKSPLKSSAQTSFLPPQQS